MIAPRKPLLKMDFPQTSNAAPFNFRPLGGAIPSEKLGTASCSNRPKMSLPITAKKDPAINRTP